MSFVAQSPVWIPGVGAHFTPVLGLSSLNLTPNPGGDSVAHVFGNAFHDAAGVLAAVAITAQTGTAVGGWQYSADIGTTWQNFPTLWLVNTRFSCLCTIDRESSFVPRWRPRFVSGLSPEDRCHLNGLGMRDGRPRYVTALGKTDGKGGWRANKRDGGCLIDVDSGEIIAEGLSMPHSPRWHDGRLWLLESGLGQINVVDLHSGTREVVATLPGFTRGLDFAGPFAFIGLSQVRETATFGGLPITEGGNERNCGVWVVDVRNGQTVAFLRFKADVQEIFAVQVLQGVRFPEIVTEDESVLLHSFVLPDECLGDVRFAR